MGYIQPTNPTVKQVPANILPKPQDWQKEILAHISPSYRKIKGIPTSYTYFDGTTVDCLWKAFDDTTNGSIALYGGKRLGKTFIACEALVIEGTANPGLYWWVGLSWKSASMKRAWRTLRKWHKQIWLAKGLDERTIKDLYVKSVEKELYFPDGFVIWFRTADNPESIQGEGVRGIVVDEIAFMPEDVWTNKIEPCTIDYGAWVVLMTSSNDDVWFEDFWQKIKAGERKTWIAREYETEDNVKLRNDPKAWGKLQEILASTPQDVIDREYKCRRKSGVAKAFAKEHVKECRKSRGNHELPYRDYYSYVAFVDGSGGGNNAYTISISHKDEKGVTVQDAKRSMSFANVHAVTKVYAELCKEYHIAQVTGDRYSGQWIVEAWENEQIAYIWSELTRSDLYKEAIIIVNQHMCEIIDDKILIEQIESIEHRRVGEYFKYDHPNNKKDDEANVWAGNLYQLKNEIVYVPEHIRTVDKEVVDRKHPLSTLEDNYDYEDVFSVIDVIQ